MVKSLFRKYGPILKVKPPFQPYIVMCADAEDGKTIVKSTYNEPAKSNIAGLKAIRDDDPFFKKKAGLLAE